jgi:hypothetical protein
VTASRARTLELGVFDRLPEHLRDLLVHRGSAMVTPVGYAGIFAQDVDLGPAEWGGEFAIDRDGNTLPSPP